MPCADSSSALLLVGRPVGEPQQQVHYDALRALIHSPLGGRPSSFVVSDEMDSHALTPLPHALGESLKALGFVSTTATEARPSFLPPSVQFRNIAPPQCDGGRGWCHRPARGESVRMQWHKLREAWAMMEAHERGARGGKRYSLVFKVRFDATPLEPFAPCVRGSGASEHGLVLHAATDRVFWGRRRPMAIAAGLFDAIGPKFESPAANPLRHRLALDAMLRSVRATPEDAWSTRKAERQHHNKLGFVPFPLAAAPKTAPDAFADPRAHTIAHLEAAIAEGASAGRGTRAMSHGLRSSAVNQTGVAFVGERDFLVWMLMHNVTVCDLGASVTALLYKGERHAHRTGTGCTAAPTSHTAASPSHTPIAHVGRPLPWLELHHQLLQRLHEREDGQGYGEAGG